jgi:hypothetical protein
VFSEPGDTPAVVTVPDSALEPLREDEVLCARMLAAAWLRVSGCIPLVGKSWPDCVWLGFPRCLWPSLAPIFETKMLLA